MTDGKVQNLARLLVVAFFLFAGLGIYNYTLHGKLQATNAATAKLMADAETERAFGKQSELTSKTIADTIQQCTAQRDGLRVQVEAAVVPEPPKAGAGKRGVKS